MSDAILIVDDDRGFRDSTQLVLESHGYTVVQAASGSAGFALLETTTFQAILLDLVLPDIDGIELAEFLCHHHPQTATIILTGCGTMDTAIRALRYGVADYLLKPCRPELLVEVTARAIANIRLRQEVLTSRLKFEQLAAATSEGIAFFDQEGLRQVNQQFCSLFGHPQKSLLGRHPKEFLEEWERLLAPLHQCTLEQPLIIEATGIHSAGTSFPLEMRVRKIASQHGATWVAAFRDISTRKRDERHRLKLQEELTNAKRMESIGLMAGSVAHDLNNILTAIVTFPELLLLEMPSTASYRDDIAKIRTAGQKAAAVVADLLTVTRGATCRKSPLNLNGLLNEYEECLDCRQLLHRYPGLTLKLDLAPDIPNIRASHLHITKAIGNLVLNSAEALGGRGTIRVTTETRCLHGLQQGYETIPAGTYVVVTVSDNGPGIPASALPHIFEPFYTKKTLGHSGTGLGLTIIWNTMRDHHGFIDIDTSTAGTSFSLYIPASYEQPGSTSAFASSQELAVGEGETVLVVDDDPSQLELTATLLRRLGYTPITATDGQGALAIVEEESVDLLLIDLWMEPGMDGYETLRRIKRIVPDQKAIITSGFFRPEDYESAQGLGIRQQLTKPYSIRNLAEALRQEISSV